VKRYSTTLMNNNNDSGSKDDDDYSPVVQPSYLKDIDEHSKLLITEWALMVMNNNGRINLLMVLLIKRVLSKLAKAIAILNCNVKIDDPMFNDNARPCLVSSFVHNLEQFLINPIQSYNNDNNGTNIDGSIEYSIQNNINSNEFNFMIDAIENEYINERNTLIHNDARHVFNLLVEKKPSIGTLEKFGPTGNIVSII
jgi:hypothetical protein